MGDLGSFRLGLLAIHKLTATNHRNMNGGAGYRSIPLSSDARTAAQWFNVNGFNRVTAQQLANNLITLSPTFAGIRAAAYNSSDASLIKQLPIHESMRLEARIDGLNIFNQVSFGVPNTTPTSTAFGSVTTQKNVPRRFQAALRLTF